MKNQDLTDEDNKDQNKDDKTERSLDSEYDISEYKLNEEILETDSDQNINDQIIQKNSFKDLNIDYKIYTNQFDEIIKAEDLENSEELTRLRKNLLFW